MNVIAPTKKGKSWLVGDLALALATGRPWMGQFQTERGDVLILDNELHRETTAYRIPIIAEARGIPPSEYDDRIVVDNLRGRLLNIHGLRRILLAFNRAGSRLSCWTRSTVSGHRRPARMTTRPSRASTTSSTPWLTA